MGNDVSNKTIVALLAVALVVTVVGTVLSVSKLSAIQPGGYLTGAPVQHSGLSNISISSITSITLGGGNNTAIDWGTGYVNGSCGYCGLDTVNGKGYLLNDGSQVQGNQSRNATCCVGFKNYTAGGFLLENTGNTNLSVNVSCEGACTNATFLGGAPRNYYEYWVIDANANPQKSADKYTEQGVADSAESCTGTYASSADLVTWGGWAARTRNTSIGASAQSTEALPVSADGVWLCGNRTAFPLVPDNSKDAGVLHFNISIDAAEVGGSGNKTSTFKFDAASS